ncbi:MAG TPA: ribonuclease HII [Candidatus Paceibacterota bacterium]|nr:ribonuclease HII [Candidatus Pacearchaeota archaeon]HRZ50530.1 ribonuclease HII [Candidatus Paceibacterota bacterium]HSA36251.1 ribonuclease HII [Candidatus Paceibacterota bacterium]
MKNKNCGIARLSHQQLAENRLEYERTALKNSGCFVVGIDEAGRGPLAGPVYAAAVCFTDPNASDPVFELLKNKIRDSKQVGSRLREELFAHLTARNDVLWGVASESSEAIDEMNILEATKSAMRKAVDDLASRALGRFPPFCLKKACLAIDGNFSIRTALPQTSFISGDRLIFSISAASIIAKVSRDRLMDSYEAEYPGYGFSAHKGYGTRRHLAALESLGILPVHRKTFAPVARLWDNFTNKRI